MSNRYRVVLSATDGAGGLIHSVWYGWSKVVIISVAHEAPKHPVMGAA